MKILGFRDVDIASAGFAAGIPTITTGLPSITPVVLPRPGALPTFGPLEIGELVISVDFLYLPGGSLTYEQAFQLLYRRLDPFNRVPGQLRAQLNAPDNTLLVTNALPRITGFSSFGADEEDVNIRSVDFVSVEGWKTLVTQTTGTVTF